MCVRYTLHATDAALGALSRALGVPLGGPDWVHPRYNVTLTDTMPVVASAGGAAGLRPMRWGIVPKGDRGSPRPRLLANARSETAETLPAFRKSVASRRCLVPANGFYEWKDEGGVKLPHLFTLRGDEPFAFAGIWDPEGDGLPETYCILTTEPNALVAQVHVRMPVILTEETMPRWLGEAPLGEGQFASITRPLDPARMAVRRVSRYVSSNRNQGPRCLEPPEDIPPEPEFNFG
jgi:putative SOS response-associated peptidase YedK